MQIGIARDVAMNKAELNSACLRRAWEELQRRNSRLMGIYQKCENTHEEI